MGKNQIVNQIAEKIKKKFATEGTGHDWYHIERVWKTAKLIAEQQKKADIFIVSLAALLHDIADWKFNSENAGPAAAAKLLKEFKVGPADIKRVVYIIDRISYKGGTEKRPMESLEGKIVQDADRLDALGAIGIARAFAMGGYWQRQLYDPKEKPRKFKNLSEYKKHKGTTINHFYEKVLLIKNKINTAEGKKLAIERHKFVENYLKQFFMEWNGEK